MNPKRKLKFCDVSVWLVKFFLANLVAMTIYSVISLGYSYNTSVCDSKTGSTRFTRAPGGVHLGVKEGHSYIRFDENGFNNAFARKKDCPDVLLMGNSHFEGFAVSPRQNVCYCLNEMFQENSRDFEAYSIASSGHFFLECACRFPAGLDEFKPSKYAVLEFSNLIFSSSELDSALDGSLVARKNDARYTAYRDIWRTVKLVPAVNILFRDLKGWFVDQKQNETQTSLNELDDERRAKIKRVVENVAEAAAARDVQAIFFYLPEVWTFQQDGTCVPKIEQEWLDFIKSASVDAGILFVDSSKASIDFYNATENTTSGFWNTLPAKGHINRYGHRLAAQELFRTIEANEAKKNVAPVQTSNESETIQ